MACQYSRATVWGAACGNAAASKEGSAPGEILYNDANSVPYVTVILYLEVK